LILNALVAAGLWFLLLRSTLAMTYVAMLVAILVLLSIAFVAVIRGSAVRLGSDQFPELHARVVELAAQFGLPRTPDVYLMQRNGALNAFAMRFMRTYMVVILSDLLEACGDNTSARDMIIGHELGHIRAGHLRAGFLLMPAAFVPFLGAALSRAREYTCDRYGCAAAADRDAALLGLAILSAGGRYGPLVNQGALMRQRHHLRNPWLVIGEWLGSHPPVSKRLHALAPDLEASAPVAVRPAFSKLRVAFAVAVVVVVGVVAVSAYLPQFGVKTADDTRPRDRPGPDAESQVATDLNRLKRFIEAERQQGRPVPWDVWDLYSRWEEAHPDDDELVDPFNGYWYDFAWRGDSYRLWSAGRDGRNDTADDLLLDAGSSTVPHRRYTSRR
jgi:Zn-dependent protease with chaperone function